MNFWQHLNQSERPEDLQGLSDSLAEHFSQLLYRGHSVADLLAHFADDFGHLPAQRLRKIAQAHRRWQVWRKRLWQIQQARKDAKLPPLPDGVLEAAPAPDQLDALVRTARLCPAGTVDDDVWPRVLRAGAALWDACMGVARKEGRVVSRARDPEAVEAAAEYDPYVRFDAGLDELAPHQWLALRRGERAGVLELRLDLPEERLMEQLERLRPQLGPAAEAREPRSLLEELVLDDFRPWLLRNLDQQCQTRAINAASESLAGFLRSPPVQAKLLGAAYAFKLNAPAAAVVVDRDGDIVDQRRVKAEPGWAEKALELLRKHEVQQVVLPTSVPAGELMSEFESALSDDLQPIRVRSAALAEARRPLRYPPLRRGTSGASAVGLARLRRRRSARRAGRRPASVREVGRGHPSASPGAAWRRRGCRSSCTRCRRSTRCRPNRREWRRRACRSSRSRSRRGRRSPAARRRPRRPGRVASHRSCRRPLRRTSGAASPRRPIRR